MSFEVMQKVKMLFKIEGYDLSLLEIKNMTKISSDTDDKTENIYAIYKNGNLHLVHIKESDSIFDEDTIIIKTVKMYK